VAPGKKEGCPLQKRNESQKLSLSPKKGESCTPGPFIGWKKENRSPFNLLMEHDVIEKGERILGKRRLSPGDRKETARNLSIISPIK